MYLKLLILLIINLYVIKCVKYEKYNKYHHKKNKQQLDYTDYDTSEGKDEMIEETGKHQKNYNQEKNIVNKDYADSYDENSAEKHRKNFNQEKNIVIKDYEDSYDENSAEKHQTNYNQKRNGVKVYDDEIPVKKNAKLEESESVEKEQLEHCSICISDLPKNEALLLKEQVEELKEEYNITDFLQPEIGSDIIRIKIGESILLACPGTISKPNMIKYNMENQLLIKCIGDNKFELNDGSTIKDIKEIITCMRMPVAITKITNNTCGRPESKYKLLQIGFELNNDNDDDTVSNKFYKIADLCWDDNLLDVYYVSNLQLPQYEYNKQNYPIINNNYKFYKDINIQQLYEYETQYEKLLELSGSTVLSKKYLKNNYLIPNYLASPTNFLYNSQQSALLDYLNTAPQWDIINKNIWIGLDTDIRNYIKSRDKVFNIYTGTHGTTTITNNFDKEELFKLTSDNNNIRVPHIFWKIIIDPNNKNGVGFIVMNNPYYLDTCNNCQFKLCDDICDKLPWIKYFRNTNVLNLNQTSYCCDVTEMSKYILEIPELNVTGLLL